MTTFAPSQRLLDLIPDGSGVALELGTCRGEAAVALQHKGYTVVGLDLFHQLLREALPGPWYAAGDMHAIPLKAESVELAAFDNGWEHAHDVRLAAREAARVLKPGARFYGMLPLWAQRSSPAHLWSVGSVDELASMLRWVGFPVLTLEHLELDTEDGEQVRYVLRKVT